MKFRNPDHATRAIIEAAKTKLKQGANLARGQSAFWYLMGGGVGGGALLAGAGILCGGYSYIVGNRVIALQVTEGVKAALAHTTIKTDGTVTLAGDREVTLKTPAVVSLDPNTALLRVVAPADMPRQLPEQVRQDERPAVAKAGVVTNYTVFKTVKFGAGEVQTGWMFKDGDQNRPSFQYCQYAQFTGNGTTQTNVDIGVNGHISALPNPSPFPAVDLRAAYEAGCIWANDAAPVAPSTSPATILTRAAKR
jgi:hypothetical protein